MKKIWLIVALAGVLLPAKADAYFSLGLGLYQKASPWPHASDIDASYSVYNYPLNIDLGAGGSLGEHWFLEGRFVLGPSYASIDSSEVNRTYDSLAFLGGRLELLPGYHIYFSDGSWIFSLGVPIGLAMAVIEDEEGHDSLFGGGLATGLAYGAVARVEKIFKRTSIGVEAGFHEASAAGFDYSGFSISLYFHFGVNRPGSHPEQAKKKAKASNYMQMGDDDFRARNYAAAEEYYAAGTKAEPGNALLWQRLGNARYYQRKPKEALEAYEMALETGSPDPKLEAFVAKLRSSAAVR